MLAVYIVVPILIAYIISARCMLAFFNNNCEELGGDHDHNHYGSAGETRFWHLVWSMALSLIFPITLLAAAVMWKPKTKEPKKIDSVTDKYALERDKRIAAYEKELRG